mmetsp:Transcript_17488/g.33789  ORF Transcript_17488/g.33789 Transcript_17488/m.33789 type:complete len:666 (-) Transcript_17488:670-2667(-)
MSANNGARGGGGGRGGMGGGGGGGGRRGPRPDGEGGHRPNSQGGRDVGRGPRGPDNRGRGGGEGRGGAGGRGGRGDGRGSKPNSHQPSNDARGGGGGQHERLLFAFQSLIGHQVLVQLKNGTVYQGVFHTAQVEREVAMVLQMAYLVHDGASAAAAKGGAAAVPPPLLAGEVNGRPFRPRGPPIKAVVIPAKEFVQVIAKEAGLVEEAAAAGAKGQGGELETDAGIGRTKMAGLVGRELVAWAPEAGETGETANGAAAPAGVSLNLEEVGGGHAGRGSRGKGGGGAGGWDQFGANREMFGVQSSFDENLYTTALKKGPDAPGISELEAERIAREIEAMQTSNPHLKEERNQAPGQEDGDEEDKFSTVMRGTQGGPTFDRRNADTFGEEGAPTPSHVESASRGGAEGANDQDAVARPEPMRVRMHMGGQGSNKPAEGEEAAASKARAAPTPAPPPTSSPASAPANSAEKPAEAAKPAAPAKKFTLNPNAKPFTLNVNAKEFTPSFSVPKPAAPPPPPAPPPSAPPAPAPVPVGMPMMPPHSMPGQMAHIYNPSQPGMMHSQYSMQPGYVPVGYSMVSPGMVRGARPPGPPVPMYGQPGMQYAVGVPPGVMMTAGMPQGMAPGRQVGHMPTHMPMVAAPGTGEELAPPAPPPGPPPAPPANPPPPAA